METRLGVILIVLTITVSGCIDIPGGSDSDAESPRASAENGGLEIVNFQTAQSELRPGQKTQLKLTLKNHHVEEISIDRMRLYNFRPLEASDHTQVWEDRCTPGQVRRNIQSNPPTITCEWTVQAPQNIDEFNSKKASPKLQILYNSKVSNSRKPVNLQFKPIEDITSNSEETKEVDNGETKLSITAENPAPLDTGSKVDVVIENSGHGEVIQSSSDSLYSVDLEPKSLFSGKCSSVVNLNPPIESKAELSCKASPDASNQVERKMVVSASYKYQKTPTVNIEVVK